MMKVSNISEFNLTGDDIDKDNQEKIIQNIKKLFLDRSFLNVQ